MREITLEPERRVLRLEAAQGNPQEGRWIASWESGPVDRDVCVRKSQAVVFRPILMGAKTNCFCGFERRRASHSTHLFLLAANCRANSIIQSPLNNPRPPPPVCPVVATSRRHLQPPLAPLRRLSPHSKTCVYANPFYTRGFVTTCSRR